MRKLLVPENDPILHRPTELYDFDLSPIKAVELSNILIDNMFYYQGLGLSSNQLGLPYKAFSMMHNEKPIVCFNPSIDSMLDDNVLYQEGCLSFPGLFLKIKRPSAINVQYFDEYKNKHITSFEGLSARVFLHEYDHLMGIVFTSKISKILLSSARKKQIINKRKHNKKYGKEHSA